MGVKVIGGTKETVLKMFSHKISEESAEQFELINSAITTSTKRETLEKIIELMLLMVEEEQAGGSVVVNHADGKNTTNLRFI